MCWTCIESKHGVKARKKHWCFFCAESIEPGSLYDRRSGIARGEGFVTMHMHPECNDATSHWDAMDYESFSEGGMKRVVLLERHDKEENQ